MVLADDISWRPCDIKKGSTKFIYRVADWQSKYNLICSFTIEDELITKFRAEQKIFLMYKEEEGGMVAEVDNLKIVAISKEERSVSHRRK